MSHAKGCKEWRRFSIDEKCAAGRGDYFSCSGSGEDSCYRKNASGLVAGYDKCRRISNSGRIGGGGSHYGPWSDARRFLCGNGGLERNQKGCECRPYSCHWKRGCGRWPYGKSADRGNRMCGSCYRQSSMGESVGFQGGEYISGNRRDTSRAELGRTACHGKETSAWIMYRKRGADGGQGNAGPCEPIFPWAS